jgi:hypothetical protein
MIIKGNTHDNGGKLADYLMAGGPGEVAKLLDMRGFATGDLHAEFLDIDLLRERATKADSALFHVQIRGVDGEGKKLTDAQLLEIADGVDLALGRHMTHQARAAVIHEGADRHLHLAYDLIRQDDEGHCFVEKLGLYKTKLQLYAREVEQKYGLQILSNERRPGARRAERNEFEEGRRLGRTPEQIHEVRTAIMQAYHAADSGKAFKAAMQERNWEVAAGDRNCFVIVDELGGKHALNKKLTGMTLKEIDAKLGDLDRSSLPSVDQAKAMQLDRAAARASQTREIVPDGIARANGSTPSHGPENAAQAAIKPLGQTAGEIRLAWRTTQTAEQFAQEIDHRGLILVHVSREEAAASYRAREFAKAAGRQNRVLKEGFAAVDKRGNVYRIDQRATGDHYEEIQKRLGALDKSQLQTVDVARAIQREIRRAEFRAEKRIEHEQAREPTKLEAAIIAADRAAGTDDLKFSETLGKAGIAIARVTADDLETLKAQRSEQDLSAAAGDEPRRYAVLANVRLGELVVVTKLGDVLRLNQSHMADLEHRNFPTPATPANADSREMVADDPQNNLPAPTVTEARAMWEHEAAMLASFRAELTAARVLDRDNATAARVAAFESGQAIEQRDAVTNSIQDATQGVVEAGIAAADQAVSFGGKVAHSLAWAAEGVIGFLGDLWASPSKPTELEREIAPKVAAERQQQTADLDYYQLVEAVRDAADTERRRQQTDRAAAPEYFRHLEPDRER